MQMAQSNMEQDNHGGGSQIPTLGGCIALLGIGKCLGGLMRHAKLPYLPDPSHSSLPTSFQKTWFLVSSRTKGICSPTSHITQGKRRGEALLHLRHLLSLHLIERTMLL